MFSEIKTKEMTFKELFEVGFELFRTNWKAIAILTLLAYIPVILLERLIIEPSLRDLVMLFGAGDAFEATNIMMVTQIMLETNVDAMPIEVVSAILRTSYTMLAATLISSIVFVPLLHSGQTYLVKETAGDRQVTGEDMINITIASIFKTAVTALVAFSCLMLGFMLFIVPGVYMAIVFAFAIPAVIVTGEFGFGALKESFLVVRGRFFKTLIFLVIVNVISFVLVNITAIIGIIIFSFLPGNIIFSAIVSLISNFVLAYFVMVECLWFVNKYFVKTDVRDCERTA